MNNIKRYYIDLVGRQMAECDDVELLDFIYRLLVKSNKNDR